MMTSATTASRILTLLVLATTVSTTVWWQVSVLPGQVLGQGPGLLPLAVADVLAAATAGAGMLGWLLRRQLPSIQPVGLFVAGALVLIAAAAGAPGATNPAIAGALTLNLLLLLALYLTIASGSIPAWQVALAIVAGLLIQVPLAFEQVARQTTSPAGLLLDWPGNWVPSERDASVLLGANGIRWLRAYGPFNHPNILGGYLAVELVTLVGLAVAIRPRLPRPIRRIGLGVLLGLGLGGLALSASRGAWLGAIAGFVALGVGWWRRDAAIQGPGQARGPAPTTGETPGAHHGAKIRLGLLTGLLPAVVTLAIVLAIFRPPLLARFDPAANTLEEQSVQERVFYDQLGLQLLAAHPLLGVGAGNVEQAEVDYFHAAYTPSPAHNVPLLMAVELGPLGAAAWGLAAATILWQTWRRPGWWTVTMAAALVTVGVAGLFDHYSWSYPVAQTTAVILAGAWAGAWRTERHSVEGATSCNPTRIT